MPFTKLGTGYHRCELPYQRTDGSPLQYGDQWQCGVVLPNDAREICGKEYRWANTQREGDVWEHVR